MIRNLKDSFGSSSLTLSIYLYVSFADKIFEKKLFSEIFMKSYIQPNFHMENSKIEFIFPYFIIFIFISASISQKCPKSGSKFFVHRFTSKLP